MGEPTVLDEIRRIHANGSWATPIAEARDKAWTDPLPLAEPDPTLDRFRRPKSETHHAMTWLRLMEFRLAEARVGSAYFQSALIDYRTTKQIIAEREAAEFPAAQTADEPEPVVGFVYFIRVGDFIKIGFTASLGSRMEQLSTASPVAPMMLHHEPGTLADERAYHKRFAACRHRLEWFRHEGALAVFLAEKLGG